eukprot:TRINITY_DN9522_c0_g1_i1.p1 TRINITY_DN9522_c0_g1~~TRINITY_DN9522_c0_g1_i1.p1  ORF type:complete len:147 (+),score=21.38 TRINITY_DN9522_c0_g1_i1:107-547(+)
MWGRYCVLSVFCLSTSCVLSDAIPGPAPPLEQQGTTLPPALGIEPLFDTLAETDGEEANTVHATFKPEAAVPTSAAPSTSKPIAVPIAAPPTLPPTTVLSEFQRPTSELPPPPPQTLLLLHRNFLPGKDRLSLVILMATLIKLQLF